MTPGFRRGAFIGRASSAGTRAETIVSSNPPRVRGQSVFFRDARGEYPSSGWFEAMLRRFRHWLAVGLLAFALPLPAQDTPPPPLQSKVFEPMPAAEIEAIRQSRRKARDELFKNHSRYDPPGIASALEDPNFLIAIAKVTAVEQQDKSVSRNLKVDLEIQQFWRGSSEKTSIYADSRWSPPQEGRYFFSTHGDRPTALDLAEPKPGNLYLIGYRLLSDSGSKAYIPGAMDFSAPGQGQTLAEIQHYLTIDASAGDSNFAPFVAALDDPVPWIRDLALHRLANSDACRAAPACGDAIISRVRELLQSKEGRERWEAVEWLQRLMIGLRSYRTESSINNETLRTLLNSAISDPNPFIGDQAFRIIVDEDPSQKLSPGQCREIIPELRKSAMWDYAEVKDRTVNSPLSSSMTCNASSPPAAQ